MLNEKPFATRLITEIASKVLIKCTILEHLRPSKVEENLIASGVDQRLAKLVADFPLEMPDYVNEITLGQIEHLLNVLGLEVMDDDSDDDD